MFGTVWIFRLLFGSVWRFRLSLGQCGELDYLCGGSDYLWNSVEIWIIFGKVWRFRLCLRQCGYSDYVLDSVEIQIMFGIV